MEGCSRLRLLLDTHIWLWGLSDPARLSRTIAGELEDPNNEVWVSPVTIWEVLVLARKGRIVLEDPISWTREALRRVNFKEAPLNYEVAIQSHMIDPSIPDPADRFLAATAIVYDLTLVTSDGPLLECRAVP